MLSEFRVEIILSYARCISSRIYCLTRWGPVRVSGAVNPGRPEQWLRLRCGRRGAVQHHQRRRGIFPGPSASSPLCFYAMAVTGRGSGCGSSAANVAFFGTCQRSGGGRGRTTVSTAVGVLARRPWKTRPADRRVDALPTGCLRPLPQAKAVLLLAAKVRSQNVVNEKVGGSVGLLGDL